MIPFILAAVGGALIGSALKKKVYADGGYIANQYIGKSAEQVWDEWTIQQREHFLNDHSKDIKEDEFYTGDEKALHFYAKEDFKKLPKAIKEQLTFHVSEGEYSEGGMMSKGGELAKEGFTIKEMNEHLDIAFPYSFGFKVYPIKKGTNLTPDYDNASYYGLEDKDIKYKLTFPQYKQSHEINYNIRQGDENTYFDFLLEAETVNDYYVGTFGFKDRGDVDSSYVTKFIAFLQEAYGLPFQIEHTVMAKGGEMYKNVFKGITFKTVDEAKKFIKLGKPFLRKQFRDGNYGLVNNGQEFFIAEIKDIKADGDTMAKGGGIDSQIIRTETINEAKPYYSSLLDKTVLGFESTWNKGVGEYEGCPVIYYSYYDNMFNKFDIACGILYDGELINESEATSESYYYKDELAALEEAKKIADDENYGAEKYAKGGLLDKAKAGLKKIEKVGKKVGHKVAVKSREYTHDAAVAISKGSAKVAKKLEGKKTTYKKKYAEGGTTKKPANDHTKKLKEVMAHAKATRKEGEVWKMAVKRSWEEIG